MGHSPPTQNPHASDSPQLASPQPASVGVFVVSPEQLSEREASSPDGFMDELLESEKAGFAVVSQSVSVYPTPSLPVEAHSSSRRTRCKEKAVSWLCLCTWLLPLFPYAFFTGPWFFNWTPYSDLLVHTGVYSWLCSDPHALPPQPSPQGVRTAGKCLAQQEAISFLFTVASTTTFCCSVLSGLLLDHLGSTVCALVGWGSMAAGWGLLACSSQASDAYPAAMGLLGFSLDAAFFPLITEARRSGQNSNFVVSALGACRSGAFALPLALRSLNQDAGVSLPEICLLVGILSCGCCIFLVFSCLPKKIPLLAVLRNRRQRKGDTQRDTKRHTQRDTRRPSGLLEPLELQTAAVRGLEAGLRERTAAAAAARRHLRMQQQQQQQQQQQSSILDESPEPSLPAGGASPSPPSGMGQQKQQQQQQQQREQPQAEEMQQQQEELHNKGQKGEPQETPHTGRQQLQPTDQQQQQQQQQQNEETQKLPALFLSIRGAAHSSQTSKAANASSPAAAAAKEAAAAATPAATAAEAETAAAEATEAAAAVAAELAARGQQERDMGMRGVSSVSSVSSSGGNVFLLKAGEAPRSQEENGFCVFVSHLKREMGDPRFYLLVLFAFMNVLNASFYLPSTAYLMSTGYTMNQIAHVFPFAFAPVWGFVADWAGIVPTMAACNLATLAAHSLLLPLSPSTLQQGVSAVFSTIRLSFLASQVYCYANKTFSRRNTGTLIGITWSLAGLGPVAAGAMRKRGFEGDDFRGMLAVTVFLAMLNEALLAALYFVTRRQPFTVYRQAEERDKTLKDKETANPLRAPIPKAVVDCLCKAAAPPAAVSPQQQGAKAFAAAAGSPTGLN